MKTLYEKLMRSVHHPEKLGRLTFLVMLMLVTSLATAQTPERPVELQQYLNEVIEENPKIRSALFAYRAQLQTIPQVGALPDPSVMIGVFANPNDGASFLGRFSIAAQQSFPWFGTLQSRRDEQALKANASFHEFQDVANQIIREVEKSWFDYYFFEQVVLLMEQQLILLEDLEPIVESRYGSAQSSQLDLLRLQMEIDRRQVMVLNHHDQIKPTLIAFNNLLNRRSFDLIEIPAQLSFPILAYQDWQLMNLIAQNNPELQSYDQTLQSLRKSRDISRKDGLPDFNIGIEVMGRDYAGMMLMEKEAIVGRVGISIPLNRNKYNAQTEQIRQEEYRVEYQKSDALQEMETELITLHKQYRNAQRNYNLYSNELLPKANQAYAVLMEAYSNGNAALDEILQIQRDILQIQMDKQEAIINGWKLISDIEALIGGFTTYTTDQQ